ncbi:MAG: exodeoxyribonuclease V subunit alpha [Rhodococcus sp. (in: high G+C Gram-positive bacteria)]|uniref:exodeoxyribonuclease V subunit alpha n=1 Tax=Rhodococcus sp. EPR-157 TaxID=1813677 RepID=UPI0007BBDCAC|nr:exodeoxyribonuclease V subunit alpha [Rhodococcus sp. EPR-157]KZF07441.1 exodeoxyribonuclease V subunit alpha [Rhodococcus sp. EPR-157]
MIESQLVQRARGKLKTFNEVGILAAADVHVALRLGALGGETSEEVLFAAALAVRAVRSGSVCLDLRRLRDVTVDEESDVDIDALPWPELSEVLSALRASPLVTGGQRGPLKPLRLVDTDEGELLYLDRYFLQERTIRMVLDSREATHPDLDTEAVRLLLSTLFVDDSGQPTAAPDRQRIAAALAATSWTAVIAGGPGTGKTHTVARVLAMFARQLGPSIRIGLAAPTGKAAARLQESVTEQSSDLGLPPGLVAMTLHRLLGWQRGSKSRFRHNASNRLPYDVIVIDETSMVSLTMMCRLLEAVRPETRLILVGDPDQLTSVDAGAVLADLVARPVRSAPNPELEALIVTDLDAHDDPNEAALSPAERERLGSGVVRLSRGRRFGGTIAELAIAVRDGRSDRVMDLLQGDHDELSFHSPTDLTALHRDILTTATTVTAAAKEGHAARALEGLESHRLLCAHRQGPHGVQTWARRAMEWVGESSGAFLDPAQWYPGQPLLVTANDHEARIYNGDTGVVVDTGGGSLMAAFQRGTQPLLVHPNVLSSVQTVYAMTIHRSQGSQYDTVSVMLPEHASSLLTRELLYTAITRARKHVRIIGTEEAVRAGVDRQVLRASGLRRTIIP